MTRPASDKIRSLRSGPSCCGCAAAIFYHKHFPLTPHGKYADGLESWKGEHTICHPICWLFCLITASSRLCQAHFSSEASDSSSGFTPQTIGQQMPLTHCAAPAPDITTHLNIIIGPIQSKYLHAPQEEYFREHSLVFFTRSAVKL